MPIMSLATYDHAATAIILFCIMAIIISAGVLIWTLVRVTTASRIIKTIRQLPLKDILTPPELLNLRKEAVDIFGGINQTIEHIDTNLLVMNEIIRQAENRAVRNYKR